MTSVRLLRSSDSVELCVRGHAGSCKSGPDPVCAAASMLVCALMERLERLRGELSELHISYESGLCEILARGNGEVCVNLHEAVEVVMCGFGLLAASFPKSVRVSRGECSDA